MPSSPHTRTGEYYERFDHDEDVMRRIVEDGDLHDYQDWLDREYQMATYNSYGDFVVRRINDQRALVDEVVEMVAKEVRERYG